jgi:hypothetical protein
MHADLDGVQGIPGIRFEEGGAGHRRNAVSSQPCFEGFKRPDIEMMEHVKAHDGPGTKRSEATKLADIHARMQHLSASGGRDPRRQCRDEPGIRFRRDHPKAGANQHFRVTARTGPDLDDGVTGPQSRCTDHLSKYVPVMPVTRDSVEIPVPLRSRIKRAADRRVS